jgi:hypothetical protein
MRNIDGLGSRSANLEQCGNVLDSIEFLNLVRIDYRNREP